MTDIEQVVAAYLTAANVPNLAAVFADPQFDMENVPWGSYTPPGVSTSAVAVVFTDSDTDLFEAFDGAGGRRICTYEMTLEGLLWDVSGDSSVANQAYKQQIAALKYRLRTDPALGTTPTGNGDIIQSAVSKLFVERGRPVKTGDGNQWARWYGIHFQVETYEYST